MAKYKEKEKHNKNNIPLDNKFGLIKKKKKFEDGKVVKKYLKTFNDTNERKKDAIKKADFAHTNNDPEKEVKFSIRESFSSLWMKYKPRSTPHVKSGSEWISQLLPEQMEGKPVPLPVRKRLKELAKKIYGDDLQARKCIQEKHNRHENKHFHKLILSHGTTKDRIAAHTFQCMESPVYSLNELFSLIEFVSPKFKDNCQEAIGNIGNLFQMTLLSNGHVAREFECHNFSILIPLMKTNCEQVEKQLVLWYFESEVQLAYLRFIENVEKLCHDSQLKIKSRGIKGLQNTLKKHPNQDTELVLQKLVNKIGDSNKKVAGDIVHVLNNIQLDLPQLKLTIVSLIEELLYRPNINSKAQYYSLCFLKDIIFGKKDQQLAERLIKLYFDFFQMCSKSGEVDSRFMGALLRGLNRAFPYVEGKRLPFLEDQIATLYKLCHMVNFTVGTQALQLIYQVENTTDHEVSDRFYSVIYRKLLDPSFRSSSASGAFLNIIFKSIVRDKSAARVCGFVRRLLQVCKYQSPHIACGILFLISEAIKDNSNIENIKMLLMNAKTKPDNKINSDDDDDDDFEYYPDLDTDKEDEEESRHETTLETSRTTDSSSNSKSESASSNFSFHDSSQSSSGQGSPFKKVKVKTESSWLHRDNWKLPNNKEHIRITQYDPYVLNPLFCGADLSQIWELQNLGRHFHPTVCMFASKLLNQTLISYSGDPLQDFTLTRFLDRFTHRNPKKTDPEKNKSGSILGSRSHYVPKGSRKIPVESAQFRSLRKGKIAAEDLFFYKYFTKYRKLKDVKKKKDDDESIDDEEFEEYLRRMSDFKDLDDDDVGDDLDFAKNAFGRAEENEDVDDEDEDIDEENEDEDIDEENEDEDIDEENEDEDIDEENEDEDIDEENEDEDIDEENEDEEEENELSMDENDTLEDEYEEYSEDNLDFGGEESDDEVIPPMKRGGKKKWQSSSGGGWRSMLVDAEEFSELLENNAEYDDPLAGTSEAVSNKDKAHAKQLKWEKKVGSKERQKLKGFKRSSFTKTNFKAKNKVKRGRRKS